ncbi:CHASE3 domain-containing protein [Streptomyces spinoverrucosus]|uniref:sensor histidine kinase n=1 Tax=Streptomyces spinoverrucosus TaxID=284043 RepID=UPI0018C3A8C0|nr:sensor histidine kinase [Streptomyces spinoverrucosus]MBG0850584.1 CHASE3 domain-containing protein [Streptomyces spinoverrucosus]
MNEQPPGTRNATAGWSTRRWLRVSVAVTLTVLAVLGSLGTWAMTRTTQLTEQIVDRRLPALTYAVRLETALVNQETGVRGYGLSGQRDFLQPYAQGVSEEKDTLRRLGTLLADDPRARDDLATVRRLSGRWQERVALPIANADPDRAVSLAASRTEAGKAGFDALRRALTTQQTHLEQERAAASRELRRATSLRNWTFTVIALVIALVAVLVFEALRRGITTPLSRLGHTAREVAKGRFDQPIAITGPADLRQLGSDVESMRGRLLEELEFSEQSRRLLDEQAADLQRSNTELEQFAYVASHDLQEPLRKVSSFTQLLQRRYGGQLDERADQYIAFAVDGANRMQVLINDLLAFSRVGRVLNDHEEVDLEDVVGRTLDNLSVAIEESGAEIGHDPLPKVVGDATQLGMLWQNLLSNSLKFRRPDRSPDIRISVATTDDGLWEFAVTDNGIGIAPEFQEKVFVLFQRLHTRDAYPGTGIGLAMCKKVVEFHGGTIWIDPEHTGGTRVVFTLPVEHSAAADGAREAHT